MRMATRVHVDNITEILQAMQKKLNAKTAHLEMEFPFFLGEESAGEWDGGV